MAQSARVAALTDELIRSILDFDKNANRHAYRQARDFATKALRPHQYNRTNQFDVQASFKGLDEKFRVLDRDDLADALGERLEELEHRRSKWIPEYLNLLLLLSDRPTENSDVKALELLRPPEEPEPLTWKELLEDDPYSDDEIWKDIDYAVESSEDERTSRKKGKKKNVEDSPISSVVDDDDNLFDPKTCTEAPDANVVTEIENAQFWRRHGEEDGGKIEITELQAIRETLFMLSGLQTSLYLSDRQNARIRVNQRYIFSHTIAKTADHLLSQMVDIGRDLSRLRQWTKRPSSLPLVQTFEAAVRKRLSEYDHHLSTLQRRYLVPENPIAVSLLALHAEIRSASRPLLRFAQLVSDIEPSLLVNPFIHLEALFEQITLAQMTLEKDIFDFFSQIFFECLQTYLKPIRHWMESGDLGANDETFFVFESDASNDVSSLWHDQFVLRRGQGDMLRCPEFLHPAALKIFNTGKSVVFLKELGIYEALSGASGPEPHLDHQTVCGDLELPMAPFPDLFQTAFEGWIRSKYSLASTVLRKHLFSQCGLLDVLRSFSTLYLGANGSVFQDYADAIFERIDANHRGWNDRFLLTELARGIFGIALGRTDAGRIVVRSTRKNTQTRSVKGLNSVSIDYALPWSVTNIVQRSAIPTYQQLFTFLLQIYRSKYLLQKISLAQIRRIKEQHLRDLCFRLRHRLTWLADILRSYLTETVIALSTENMIAAMEKAEDIDEMSTIHIKYLAKLQEQALLADNLKPIHSSIISLLDLSVLFHDAHAKDATHKASTSTPDAPVATPMKQPPKLSRRKSIIPTLVENGSSDEDDDAGDGQLASPEKRSADEKSFEQSLRDIHQEFSRLLPFVTAGLRTIGRVGADPVWEMLAERLEWDKKRDR